MRSFFKLLKNDSTTTLSQPLPGRRLLVSRWLSRQNRRQSSLPYRVPCSQWIRTRCPGFQRQTAINTASRTKSLTNVGFMDQPTTLRAGARAGSCRHALP